MVKDTIKRVILTAGSGIAAWWLLLKIGVPHPFALVAPVLALLLSHRWAGRCALAWTVSSNVHDLDDRRAFNQLLPIACAAANAESVEPPRIFVALRGKRPVFAAGTTRRTPTISVHQRMLGGELPNKQLQMMIREELRYLRMQVPLMGTLLSVSLVALGVIALWGGGA